MIDRTMREHSWLCFGGLYVSTVVLLWRFGSGLSLPLAAVLSLGTPLLLLLCWQLVGVKSSQYDRPTPTTTDLDPRDEVEFPRLALVHMTPMPCRICAKPLKDQDTVVWSRRRAAGRVS